MNLNFINEGNRRIVDAYDELNDMGLIFQDSPISEDEIKSHDAKTYVDWIFRVEHQFMRLVEIGNIVVCEIPHGWETVIKTVKNNIYLYTGFQEWARLESREAYSVEICGKRRQVWFGKPCTFQEVYDETCLQNVLTTEGETFYRSNTRPMERERIVYARCRLSMYFLDSIHRDYVNQHTFKKGEIVAIKSVAGSGKTTTLLTLAKLHSSKRILYLAFNKSLIGEIQSKLKTQNIRNMYPCTFDALLVSIYSAKRQPPQITYLNPQSVTTIIPWLKKKPFPLRKETINLYTRFCRQIQHATPQEYCIHKYGKEKPLLTTLWTKTQAGELDTFEGFRKLSIVEHWFRDYIDATYDMVMIDETQDFDLMMLRMLLDDTTIPKIFVGDPKQSIYKWRGCINGFEYMPEGSLILEFYSTFRIGEPACEAIRQKFDDCWMISKSGGETELSGELSFEDGVPYTYLFRTWRLLLTTAETIPAIWITGLDKKLDTIRKQHEVLHKGYTFDDDEFEDDLPLFLKSITVDELEAMIARIEANAVTKERATCKLYTVHSYKGLEDDNIRLAKDIQIDDENLYYVALTRGKDYILEDERDAKGGAAVKPVLPAAATPTLPTNNFTMFDFLKDVDTPEPPKTAPRKSLMFHGAGQRTSGL